MQQNLINQLVGLEFNNKLIFVEQAAFIERKSGIHIIIGNRSFDY